MAKLFESIGNIVGGVARGASDLFDVIPAVRASRTSSDLREQQIINNAANMLINTPPEEQGNILAALDRIGLDKDAIAAAQQIAASGQPLSLEEGLKLGKESGLARQFDITPTGKFGGGRLATPTAGRVAPPVGTLRKATVQSRRFDEAIADIEKNIAEARKDDDADRGQANVDRLVPQLQKARDDRDRFEATQTGLVEETIEEAIPAVTRPAGFFESILPGGVKRGSTVEVTPATTRTRTRFVPPNIATTETAPTELAPEPPQPATKKKKTKVGADAKSKGRGMQILRKALADKVITATEFKTIQNGIRNKTITVEQALARLEQIRKG